jgi:hypothetical protein
MRNLSQSTYNRIVDRLRDTGDRFPRGIHPVDAADLLEAYESAVRLLDHILESCVGSKHVSDAEDFLYLPTGEPRVELDDEEELSYSARGLLRPTDVASQDDD